MGKHYDYTAEMIKFIKLKCESLRNNTAIARQLIKEFDIHDLELDAARKYIQQTRRKIEGSGKKIKIKRLFWDIETGYYKTPVFAAFKQFVKPENLEGDKKIICISYKWQYEDKVHTLKWDGNQDDKKILEKFIKIIGQADEIVAHNGDKFDIKELRTRALLQGVLMFPKYRTIDTLKKSRKFFRFPSNSLNYLGIRLDVTRKLDSVDFDLWRRCQEGWSKNPDITGTKKQIQKEALAEMVNYCEHDVMALEDVFNFMMPFIDHNTNYSVLNKGPKWGCPECAGKDVQLSHTDTTPMGYIKRHMKCNDCKKGYHISNRSYQSFLTKHIKLLT
jgi:DNA polymerase elongation subunit (family B)